MASIKETLELSGVPAYRIVKKTTEEPEQYCTFQRILIKEDVAADDVVDEESSFYKVNIFSKVDFEALLSTTKKNLSSAGFIVNSVDAEIYESDTGYYHVPLSVQELHAKE